MILGRFLLFSFLFKIIGGEQTQNIPDHVMNVSRTLTQQRLLSVSSAERKYLKTRNQDLGNGEKVKIVLFTKK